MRNRQLGFITGSGILAGVLTVILVAGIGLARGGVLFSPGALNSQPGNLLGGITSHADLQGKCSGCHTAFWESATMDNQCTSCHANIAIQLQDPTALHGILWNTFSEPTCRSCHPEHRGSNASLTEINEKNFPHEKLGFPLVGMHLSVGCSGCHANNSFSDAPTDCYSCHFSNDIHEGKYGTGCESCHTPLGWSQVNFDHSLSGFKLLGKHADIACTDCHINNVFKNTSTECISCHAKDDSHNGLFGSDCGLCHSPSGWLPATFDHSQSAFPLNGKHIEVNCTDCHVNAVFKGTPTDCYSCHSKDDKHAGQFGTDCSLCHSTAGWLPATFDHNLAAFKLTGKHAQVECVSCHVNNIFKGTPTDCYSCHAAADKHNGQFGRDCSACHTTSGWLPANFNHSGFPLTAGHAGLACTRCHSSGVYAGLSTSCVSCHGDPAYHQGLFGTNCAQCHTTSNWYASYSGPHPNNCEGPCINHEGASCRDCHTVNLSTATCTKCHQGGAPGGGGGDD